MASGEAGGCAVPELLQVRAGELGGCVGVSVADRGVDVEVLVVVALPVVDEQPDEPLLPAPQGQQRVDDLVQQGVARGRRQLAVEVQVGTGVLGVTVCRVDRRLEADEWQGARRVRFLVEGAEL